MENSQNKKALVVVTRKFWPMTTGKETTLYYDCKGLKDKYGYDVYLFCFADKGIEKNSEKPKFIKDVEFVDVPSKSSLIKNFLSPRFWNEKWPMQNALFYDKEIQKKLECYFAKIEPDVIFIDMVRLVPYIRPFVSKYVKKILIADDNLAKRYNRQLNVDDKGNAVGYYSKNMNGVSNKLFSNKLVKSVVLRFEINRLQQYEFFYEKLFDYITFISPIEANEFNQKHDTSKALSLSMGADVDYYSKGEAKTHYNKSVVFVGNYTYAPNADSIEMICRDIMPKLDNDTTMYVVGKCPDYLRQRIEDPRVKVLGFVDDIRATVMSMDVYLAPITYGTGIKTKIVEAMAMGMPVVTNSVGAESLAIENGKELIIADSVDEIVVAVKRLMSNVEERKRLGEAGKKFVLEHHSWDKVYEAYGEMGL